MVELIIQLLFDSCFVIRVNIDILLKNNKNNKSNKNLLPMINFVCSTGDEPAQFYKLHYKLYCIILIVSYDLQDHLVIQQY